MPNNVDDSMPNNSESYKQQRAQNQQVQGALQQFQPVIGGWRHGHGSGRISTPAAHPFG